MKRYRFLMILMVLLIALVLPSAGFAKRFSYTAGFQIQNMSASNKALVTIRYYNNQNAASNPGALAQTADDTVNPSTSNTYFPIHADPGFDGSVVVSSSEQVASIVNLLGSSGGTFKGAASYIGSSTGANSVQLPLLMKGNAGGAIDTWFAVQNAGSGPTTVNVQYTDGTTAGPIKLEANASYTFDQSLESHNTKVFAATVTSGSGLAGTSAQPLVGVVVQETDGGTVLAYTGFSAGSTNPVFPLINAQPSRQTQTGITIRNMDPTKDSDVTVEYISENNGPRCTETRTIAHQSIQTFALEVFAGAKPAGVVSDCAGGADFKMVGSAYVKTNSNNVLLAGVVNQITPSAGAAYSSFSPTDATNKVVFPLIMDRNAGYFTSITIMNVGAKTNVTCTYTGVDASFNDSASIDQYGSMVLLQNNKFTGMSKYVGSAVCSSADASAKIVGVVNEVVPGGSTDTLLTYEGINPK